MARIVDGPSVTVAGSNGASYQVYALGTRFQYCTCPSWRFHGQKKTDAGHGGRTCKHIDRLLTAGVKVPLAPEYLEQALRKGVKFQYSEFQAAVA